MPYTTTTPKYRRPFRRAFGYESKMKITNADLNKLKSPTVYSFLDNQSGVYSSSNTGLYKSLARGGHSVYKPHSYGATIQSPDIPLGLLRKLDAGVNFSGEPLGYSKAGSGKAVPLTPLIPKLREHDLAVQKYFRNKGISTEGTGYLSTKKYSRSITQDRLGKLATATAVIGVPTSLYAGRRWLRGAAKRARKADPANPRVLGWINRMRKELKDFYVGLGYKADVKTVKGSAKERYANLVKNLRKAVKARL